MTVKALVGPDGLTRYFKEMKKGDQTKMVEIEKPADTYEPEIKPEIKTPESMPHGMSQAAIDSRNRKIKSKNMYEQSLIGDEHGQMLKKQAEEMGGFTAGAIGAGHTINKLGAGIADIADAGLDYLPFYNRKEEAKKRRDDRKVEQAKLDNMYRHVSMENPGSSVIGEAIPYIATSMMTSPLVNAFGREGTRLAGNVFNKYGDKVEDINNMIQASESSLGKLAAPYANKFKVNTNNSRRIKPLKTDAYNTAGSLANTAGVGALEGTAHYDMSAMEGAGNSVIGGVMGTGSPVRMLERVNNRNSPYMQSLIEKYEDAGMRVSPGMKMGNTRLQRNESAMNSHPEYTDYMKAVRDHNDEFFTDRIASAIGMKKKEGTTEFTPDDFNNHRADLKASLEANQAGTVGRFLPEDGVKTNTRLDRLSKSNSPRDKATMAELKSFQDEMRRMSSPNRDSKTGRMNAWTYDGAKFQDLNSRLRARRTEANSQGQTNKELSDGLGEMIDALETSITRGMDHGGTVNPANWRRDNERYALTELFKDSGVNPTGSINLDSLSNRLMSGGEAARTVSSSGGQIKELQDIIKMNYIKNNQAGSDMSGVEMMANSAGNKVNPVGDMATSVSLAMDPRRRMFTDLYMRGWPLTKGLKPGTSRQVSRASAQAGGPLEMMDRFTESATSSFTDDGKGISPKATISDMLGLKPSKAPKTLDDFIEYNKPQEKSAMSGVIESLEDGSAEDAFLELLLRKGRANENSPLTFKEKQRRKREELLRNYNLGVK